MNNSKSNCLDSINTFTIAEAGELIVGQATGVAYCALVRQMKVAFISTCGAYVDFFLNPLLEDSWYFEPMSHEEDTGNLPSAIMTHIWATVEPWSAAWEPAQSEMLKYLDRAIDEVEAQRFYRNDIGFWLEERGIRAAYEFVPPRVEPEKAPEDRLAEIERLLLELGGNKSAVAERLGIGRQRVGQILTKRRPQGLAQDPDHPFGWGRQASR